MSGAASEDLPWSAARDRAWTAAEPLPPVELPLEAAVGLVLTEPVTARVPLPPFDTAAMDGYAVAGPGPWRVVGRCLAGATVAPAPLQPGTATEVATGAMAPPGTDAVLPYEDSARDGGLLHGDVHVQRRPARRLAAPIGQPPVRHVRRTGEECAAGELLIGAGAVVTPPAAGLAAAVGYDALRVRPRPRVALLVSGDELATAGLPGPGQVRDALGPQLPSLVRYAGGLPDAVRYVRDGADELAAALAAAAAADVVVTTGASSVGPADHLPGVLRAAGGCLLVHGVRCRPGHPQLLARLPDGRLLVGLPGNPLAALSGVVTLLTPVLHRLAGRPLPAQQRAVLHGPVTRHPTATRLVPVTLRGPGVVLALGHTGAAMLRGAALADALAVVPPGADAEPHTELDVELLPLPR